MSIFAHALAIAASQPKTKCANCRHHEAIIADLQAWVEDLRQSRDHWRELALDAEPIADHHDALAADREPVLYDDKSFRRLQPYRACREAGVKCRLTGFDGDNPISS
jgi:hypothetical protein